MFGNPLAQSGFATPGAWQNQTQGTIARSYTPLWEVWYSQVSNRCDNSLRRNTFRGFHQAQRVAKPLYICQVCGRSWPWTKEYQGTHKSWELKYNPNLNHPKLASFFHKCSIESPWCCMATKVVCLWSDVHGINSPCIVILRISELDLVEHGNPLDGE